MRERECDRFDACLSDVHRFVRTDCPRYILCFALKNKLVVLCHTTLYLLISNSTHPLMSLCSDFHVIRQRCAQNIYVQMAHYHMQ